MNRKIPLFRKLRVNNHESSSDAGTRIVITFSDSSQIVMGPDTAIQLPDYQPGDFEVTVIDGYAEFRSNFFTNLFLQHIVVESYTHAESWITTSF